MWVLPVPLLVSIFLGLVSLGALIWSLWTAYRIARKLARGRNRTVAVNAVGRSETVVVRPEGRRLTNRDRRLLWAVAAILVLSVAGRHVVLLFKHSGADAPLRERAATRFIARPDGTRLAVQVSGPAGAPAVVLTHGWGVNSDLWSYAKRDLSPHYQVITWDLPGLGQSTQPANRDYSLDKMADDLKAVLSLTDQPAILVGHSIGGMINLTFCRRYPADLGSRVKGIVQMDSTYTNPVRTTKNSALATALQKPVAEPLLHAAIALSPLVRTMNALRYWNGMSHLQNASQSFAGTETREQLDFVSRSDLTESPAVIARGGLAMFHWDGSEVLKNISVPVLLIVGDRDTTTVPAASEHMKENLRQASMQTPGPAKHYGPLERYREYNASVLAFANSRLGAAETASVK